MSQDKVYEGTRNREKGWVEAVTVNGKPLHDYYECGFEWGYGGAGPHGLSLSILCDYLGVPKEQTRASSRPDGTVTEAQYYWGAFLEEFVRQLPREEGFRITSQEIADWIASKPPFEPGGYETLRSR